MAPRADTVRLLGEATFGAVKRDLTKEAQA